MKLRGSNVANALLALATGALVAACAGPYAMTKAIDPGLALSLGEGVRLAARAMQAVGYFPTRQSDSEGRVIGERSDKDAFRTDVFTLYIDARLSPSPTGGLQMHTTCSISQNMVYTDQLDDECEKFQRAFDRLLGERAAGRRNPATGPVRAVPDERAVPPAVVPARPPERPRSFNL